jgi:hypothetical protein
MFGEPGHGRQMASFMKEGGSQTREPTSAVAWRPPATLADNHRRSVACWATSSTVGKLNFGALRRGPPAVRPDGMGCPLAGQRRKMLNARPGIGPPFHAPIRGSRCRPTRGRPDLSHMGLPPTPLPNRGFKPGNDHQLAQTVPAGPLRADGQRAVDGVWAPALSEYQQRSRGVVRDRSLAGLCHDEDCEAQQVILLAGQR